jgi:hypothetical protein
MGGKVGVLLAQTRLCPERLASGGVSQLGRRQGLPVVAVAQDGKDIPAARRSRVGICGTGRNHDPVSFWRRLQGLLQAW